MERCDRKSRRHRDPPPCWAQAGSAAANTTTSETIARAFMGPSYSCHKDAAIYKKFGIAFYERKVFEAKVGAVGALRLPRRLVA